MYISMNKEKMDSKRIHALLNQTYWASDRTHSTVIKSISTSECVAVYNGGLIIGFARIVTDYSTVFWICDVVVDPEFRGQGIGKMILNHIKTLEYYKDLKGILATKDAHGLYEQYGFQKETEKFMTKSRGVE
ncbi:MAG: GNAT family N-acetyltransferase [Clostridiales bacterium]|nr:GNAT family N-acetyltransferase [Clostridiales bacterium]